jgi:hypothetical protein
MVAPQANATTIKSAATVAGGVHPQSAIASNVDAAAADSARANVTTCAGR